MNRREFLKGASLGLGAGALGAMGLYSYTPARRAFLPDINRQMSDFGVCKSVKVTNISETSWFDNGVFMKNVTGAGGLLVDQYTYNWAPFGNGKGIGKGSYEEGIAKIKPYIQKGDLHGAWAVAKENSVDADNAGGFSCLVEVEAMDGKVSKYLFDCGWNYDWMEESFKREGIDNMLANGEIDGFIQTHEHMDHYWAFPVVAKYGPNVHVYTPSTFYPQGKQYIKDSGHHLQGVRGNVPVLQRQGRWPGQHHRVLPPGHHPVRRYRLQGTEIRKGSVLWTVRRPAHLAL